MPACNQVLFKPHARSNAGRLLALLRKNSSSYQLGKPSLAQQLAKPGKSCASTQLAQFHQKAALDRQRFEALVNNVSNNL